MNEDTKKRWVADLRSVNYKQSKYMMYDGQGGFCCLGVLLYKTLGLPLDSDTADSSEFSKFCKIENKNYDPETPSLDGYAPNKVWGVLASMNDGRGPFKDNPQSFNQIADYIENNL